MPTESRANWVRLLDPLVDNVWHDNLKKTVVRYPELFNIDKIDKASSKDLTGVGLEDWRVSGEGEAAIFTSNIQGFTKNYIPNIWKSGFQVTREMKDDDLYNIVVKDAAKLAQTAIRTIDKEAAKVFQNATSTTYASGADGIALQSAAHLREDGGTNLSNTQTGVLNEGNLETALVSIAEELDGRGEIIDINPTRLLIPPALSKEATILLKSTGRTATANNDINPYTDELSIMSWKRIGAVGGGSDTAWFIIDDTLSKMGEGLNVKMRVSPEIGRETVDEETHVHKWVGYMRFDIDFTDWRSVYGSTGAG